MAEAQLHNGRAIVAYRDGVAIDSEGAEIPGAPKQAKNTPPEEQPGALGGPTPEERIGIAIAQALANPKAVLAKGGANVGTAKPSASVGSAELPEGVEQAPADRTAASGEGEGKPAAKRSLKRTAKKA